MTTALPTLVGTWNADTVHSHVDFKVRHMGVGKARGTFDLSSATLSIGEHGLASGEVKAVIDATSVDTKNPQRDQHVLSPDFLDVENHPSIEFVSSGVREVTDEGFVLDGTLTIRGTTKPVELEVEYLGVTVDAYGADRLGFSGKTTISRKDYGVSFNAAFGAGNSVVADKVEIDLELEFVRDAA
jgi:polyisoprenoid-binding protein YceI